MNIQRGIHWAKQKMKERNQKENIKECEHMWEKPNAKVWLCYKCRKMQNFSPQENKKKCEHWDGEFYCSNCGYLPTHNNWEEEWWKLWVEFTNHIRTSEEVFKFFQDFISNHDKELVEKCQSEMYEALEEVAQYFHHENRSVVLLNKEDLKVWIHSLKNLIEKK